MIKIKFEKKTLKLKLVSKWKKKIKYYQFLILVLIVEEKQKNAKYNRYLIIKLFYLDSNSKLSNKLTF